MSTNSSTRAPNSHRHDNDESDVALFKEFLRINTMHPNPDLAACVTWISKQAAELGMSVAVVEYHPGLPVVITTKEGRDPSLPSVVLNCHMDVVPVVAEMWDKLPAGETPFTAWEDAAGNIYARGAQDMKCVGAQYLCALRRLGGKQASFLRTVHTLWVPDEEIGGPRGMQEFVRSAEFRRMNMGVALDEGLAHDENTWVVHYGERAVLWVVFTAQGEPGHGAKLLPNTVGERLARVVERLTARRERGVHRLASESQLKSGDVTSVNWTMSQFGTTNDGGKTYAYNVIPASGSVGFDVRAPLAEYDDVMREIEALATEFNLTVSWPNGGPDGRPGVSSLNSAWYKTIEKSLSQWGAKVQPAIFPAGTDSNYLRQAGVPAFGFSPMRNLPSTLHEHNEYLPRSTFLEGIKVYADLIPALANLASTGDAKL
jgi:aminoacylase